MHAGLGLTVIDSEAGWAGKSHLVFGSVCARTLGNVDNGEHLICVELVRYLAY